jgi:hypothetical protein
MKYFRVNETDASGSGRDFWSYYKFEEGDIELAISEFEFENPWVFMLDARRNKAEEITEEEYHAGLNFNKYYERASYDSNKNIFPLKIWAKMFGARDKLVRVGYPNHCLVYRFNDNGDMNFLYHEVK